VKPITPEKLKEAFQSIDNQISKVFKKILVLEDDEKLNYAIKQLFLMTITSFVYKPIRDLKQRKS
jgi:CO dehydrogenase/acetyl-CoA synthase alpha subunit